MLRKLKTASLGLTTVGTTLALMTGAALAQQVAVITPYLAQPGTQFYVEAFEAAADEAGWDVNVIDTQNDVAAVISTAAPMLSPNRYSGKPGCRARISRAAVRASSCIACMPAHRPGRGAAPKPR